MPQSEVIVSGGCVTDLMVYTPRFPEPGETLVAQTFQYDYGGKGANVAFMCSRLGLNSALLAKLGDDFFGKNYLRYLETAGINVDQVTIENNCLSPSSNITVTANGENTIAYFPGSADRLTEADVDRAESLFQSAKVFACVFESPLPSIHRALMLSRKHGVTTYVNAAPIVATPLPRECLPLIDYICVNETEGSALVCQMEGRPREHLDDSKIADFLLDGGVGTVILTKGEKGAKFCQKFGKPLLVPVDPVEKVVDTTGAGDAFNGAFLYQLVRNRTLSTEAMVRNACCIASLTVQRKGTQASYPHRDEIPERFL
ncbi:ribokinase-like [Tropilaelaps mercedesae]|uniref:Ribokinase n=1 Tax=Tropilaelaps mercedesae TaxID=418985 RepID=A0A1V9WYY5_9ACAR|nr:ribokinase-like [Tropilaelaps mercedesae]